jgi:hypothetical protein
MAALLPGSCAAPTVSQAAQELQRVLRRAVGLPVRAVCLSVCLSSRPSVCLSAACRAGQLDCCGPIHPSVRLTVYL